jgi:hypothetical protein
MPILHYCYAAVAIVSVFASIFVPKAFVYEEREHCSPSPSIQAGTEIRKPKYWLANVKVCACHFEKRTNYLASSSEACLWFLLRQCSMNVNCECADWTSEAC